MSELELLVEKLERSRANGDPEKYAAFISVKEAHEIASYLRRYMAIMTEAARHLPSPSPMEG